MTVHAVAAAPARRRRLAFAAIIGLCVAGAAGYAAFALHRTQRLAAQEPQRELVPLQRLPRVADGSPFLLFRSTALGDSYGRVSLERPDGTHGRRGVSDLRCDRVHFAAGHGLCLVARRGAMTSYEARLFDASLQVRHTWALAGPPSRARISPDGRRAAMTVFVAGHSYANTDFTTRTSVLDADSGEVLVDDLESFAVQKDGQPFRSSDFNFWGVTFARDGRRFYATLGSAGKLYLIEGDLDTRRAYVIHENVECPSLSPDEKHIAFKRRRPAGADGRIGWGIVVLDLASGNETPLLREARSVDDQVEWLSNGEIVYGLPEDTPGASAATDTWALAIDDASAPRLFVPKAFSPAIVRSD